MAGPGTVVLVHGVFHGGWCWDRVAGDLRRAGVSVVVAELPSCGEAPAADLHDDAAHVASLLDGVPGGAVLVGHSYGGAVVTEAGVHPAVDRLVYLAAFMLDGTETVSAAAAGEPGVEAIDHSGRPDAGALITFVDEAVAVVDPGGAVALFYDDCPPDVAADAVARLRPQCMTALRQRPSAVAWHHRPSTYVVCERDMAVHPDLQRLLARRAGTSLRWPTGHSPFLSRPDLVTDLLLSQL